MASAVNSVGSSSSSNSSSAASALGATAPTEQMFLQLLVAQLKNQDPLNPVDGTAFVTQLAEFQQLDTSISTGSDVSSILQDLNTLVGNNGDTGTGKTGATAS